jgi:hypothetical protein
MDLSIHRAIFIATSLSTVLMAWMAFAAPVITSKEIVWSCIIAGAHVVSGNKLLKELK